MSSYICNPEHIGVLAAFIATHDAVIYKWKQHSTIETATFVAREFMIENIQSVSRNYPDTVDGHRPGPVGFTDVELVIASQHYAKHFVEYTISPPYVQLFKLMQCLKYQCNDRNHAFMLQLDWLNNAIIRTIPGYEGADWEFNRVLPEVEALREKE